MTTALSAQFDINIKATQISKSGDVIKQVSTLFDYVKLFNTAGDLSKMYAGKRTLAASGTEDLDFAGSLTDVDGTAITFTKIKFIAIKNLSTASTAALSIKKPASNGFTGIFNGSTDKMTLTGLNAFTIWAVPDGATVTAGTADKLTVTNDDSAAATDYEILLLGI